MKRHLTDVSDGRIGKKCQKKSSVAHFQKNTKNSFLSSLCIFLCDNLVYVHLIFPIRPILNVFIFIFSQFLVILAISHFSLFSGWGTYPVAKKKIQFFFVKIFDVQIFLIRPLSDTSIQVDVSENYWPKGGIFLHWYSDLFHIFPHD